MIARKNRFHGRGSLNYLYKNGRTERADFLSLRIIKSKYDEYRLAVVVSKKVSKKAVVRNKIRRRIYEIVRNLNKEYTDNWQVDMMISVFDESIATMPTSKLEDLIKKLFIKSRII